jgi:hypothetical protein
MLGLLFLASTHADPPLGIVPLSLFVNEVNFSGSWELALESEGRDNRIVLVPASSPVRSGYAWRLRRSP